MKLSQLIRKIDELNLEYELLDDPNLIINIWTPYNDKGIKLEDGKYYSNDTLATDDITLIRGKYLELAQLAFDNNLKIKNINYIEFNLIANMQIELGHSLTTASIKNNDIELEPTEAHGLDIKVADLSYEGLHPQKIFNNKLRKHEKEKVLNNILDLLSYHNDYGRATILLNLVEYSNFIEPLIIALDEQYLDTSFMIEETHKRDVVYYENFKKLFATLSTYESTYPIDLSYNRGYLSDFAVESPKTMKQICENWEFTNETAHRVLTFLIQNEQTKALGIFLKLYPPFQIEDYIDIVEQGLLIIVESRIFKLFLYDWVDLSKFKVEILNDLDTFVIRLYDEPMKLLVKGLLDVAVEPNYLFKKLLDSYANSNLYNPFAYGKKAMKLFINLDMDFTYRNAYVLNFFTDDQKVIDKIVKDPKVVEVLVASNNFVFLPEEIKSIFVF